MEKKEFDVTILGCGPAGLQAAIHAVRSKVSVLVLGKPEKSSIYNSYLENYCCLDNILGNDLLLHGMNQAENQGVVYLREDVIDIQKEKSKFIIRTESDRLLISKSIIMATGVSRNRLNIPGETEFKGKGVSYCVDCDANFFKGLPVAVIGNESAAVTGALTLTFFTNDVSLIYKKLDISESLFLKLKKSNIKLFENLWVKEIQGGEKVETVILNDNTAIGVRGIFIELGAKGIIEFASILGIELDESMKFIKTDKKQKTNLPGFYAAGDICGPPWQVAKAIGEGCVAGLEAAKYAKNFGE